MKRTLNFIGNLVGVTALLLVFAVAFYHLTNDYFLLWGKHRDFSLFGWGMMLLLWGCGYYRLRKHDNLLIELACWVTLLCFGLEAYRFMLYAGNENCHVYLRVIMGIEIGIFVLAILLKRKMTILFAIATMFLTLYGSMIILPSLLCNIYLDIAILMIALLWLALIYVKNDKVVRFIKCFATIIIVSSVIASGWQYYDLKAEGIRFYERPVKEAVKKNKVSVVVPVYNAEKVIERALDSLRHQTLREIEIIAVDDGSTDKTAEILDKYAAFDKRIKVIHQQNTYVGAARNRGMAEAKGEYIGFIDSDDRVSLNYFEELYKEAKKYDAEVVYTTQIWKVTQKFPEIKEKMMFGNLSDMVHVEKLGSFYVWNKLYKLDFLRKHGILFTTWRTFSEDIFFSFQVFMYADKIRQIDNVAYYLSRYDISTTVVRKFPMDKALLDMYLDLDELIKNAGFDEKRTAEYMRLTKNQRNSLFKHNYRFQSEEDRPVWKQLIKDKFPDDEIDFDKIDEETDNKKEKIKVSVIVPVYNAARTIRRTMDSLLKQSLKEMEIIVVNDGSTDNTAEIVSEYMQKNPQIKMLTQENAYVGAARNHGQREARGEYIAFIDADDTLSENFYEKMYETAKKNDADVVAAEHVVSVWEKENREELYLEREKFTDKDVIEDLADYRAHVLGYLWDKIYRADFLREHNIWGTLRRTPAEDNYFTTQVLLYADKMYVAKGTTHYYWRGAASETGIKYTSVKDEIIEMFGDLEQLMAEADVSEEKKQSFFVAVAQIRQKMLANYFDCLKDEDKDFIKDKVKKMFPDDEIELLVPANDNVLQHQLYQKVL